MIYTDMDTRVTKDYIPLAFANGAEWSFLRRGADDRFDCLYRNGVVNKTLWYLGALYGVVAKKRPCFLR